MNNKITARIKSVLTSFILFGFMFALSCGQAKALTTTFATDSSWKVTSTNFPSWNTIGYALNSSWVTPGGGNVNCGIVQTGVVGVPKIWFPATNSLRTCYFRKSFSINQLCEVKSLTVDIAAADTYILYVNGIAIASGGATAKTVNIPVQVLQCENVIAIQARDIDAKCWWMSAKVTINSTPFAFTASSNSPATNQICAGQSLNLTSTGLAGATYAWTGPSGFTSNQQNPTVSSISMLDSGIYTVVVKVGKCCRYVATTLVKIKDCKECLDLSIKDIVCKNGVYSVTICVKNNSSHVATNINLISTTPGVVYLPNILSPPGGLLPGQTYCKTVVLSGPGAVSNAKICLKAMLVEIKNCQQAWFCTSQDDFCVELPECVKPCIWSAIVKDSTLTICRGTSVTLAASTSPVVAGATYVWSSTPASTIVNGNTATPTVTPLASPTVYTVTITTVNPDGTLCKKKANVTVNLKDCPSIVCDSVKVGFILNTINLCLGDSVQLNPTVNPSTGLTYLWMPSTGLNNATIKNPWAKPLVTTTYNFIVSVPGTTCKKDASITVIVKPCTSPVLCDWRAMVKDTTLGICKGSSTMLSAYTVPAVSGATYTWTSSPVSTIVSGNTANPTVTPSASPTIYTVTISVMNSDGTVCTKTANVKVFWKDCPPIQIPCDSVKVSFVASNINLCLGDSVQLNPIANPISGLTYEWIPATGLNNAFIKNPWAKPTVTTTYFVVAGIPNTDCKKKASITVTVIQCSTIPNGQRKTTEEEASDEITIAPNPTQSVISVQIPDSFNWKSATLINSKGVVLNELERTDNAKSAKFDVQFQPSGMYIISVKTDKGLVNKKVMKE